MSYGWHKLGRFRVLWRPLPTCEVWTTHWIYLRGRCIGKQLSVPTESDCEWYASNSGTYATADESHKPLPYREQQARRRTGRPTNAERAAREAALLTEIP